MKSLFYFYHSPRFLPTHELFVLFLSKPALQEHIKLSVVVSV